MHKTAQHPHKTPAQQPLLSRREQGVVHGAVCSPVQCAQTATESHRERVRESLRKVDGGLLALADLARERFGPSVKLEGVAAMVAGQSIRMGRFAPGGDLAGIPHVSQPTVDNGGSPPVAGEAPPRADDGARTESRVPDSGNFPTWVEGQR